MEIRDIIRSIKRKRNKGLKQGYIYAPYIMVESTPFVIESSANLYSSKKLLNRYGHKAAPKENKE